MADKILQEEILSDEELEKVASGAIPSPDDPDYPHYKHYLELKNSGIEVEDNYEDYVRRTSREDDEMDIRSLSRHESPGQMK